MAEEEKKPEAEEAAEGAAPLEGAAAAETPADGAAPAEGEGEEGKEELAPIIVKKIIDEGHGGAHGGAWKIALADMMTAMMAFFLLMWLLGATNTSQRKSIADYFKPTALTKSAITVNNTSGSIGVMGGQSIIDETALPNSSAQTGLMQVITPREDTGSKDSDKSKDKTPEELDEEAKKKVAKELDQENFEKLVKELNEKLSQDKDMAKLKEQVNFVREKEGLRIEVIDKADFSMFALGTNQMSPKAQALIAEIAKSVAAMPNPVKVRGHTDALPFNKDGRNNWSLSAERAEITRQMMVAKGVPESRFSRIEGVADKEPFNATDPKDPRNRRISITLQYRD
jgi:chemotaxis protein MotB